MRPPPRRDTPYGESYIAGKRLGKLAMQVSVCTWPVGPVISLVWSAIRTSSSSRG